MLSRTATHGGRNHGEVEPARVSLVILPCPTCGRAVHVFGRVRRVLCGCGEILMEIERDAREERA